VPAATPYFPKKVPIIAIAALAAMICSITLIAIGELMSNDGAGRSSRRAAAAMAVPAAPVAPPRPWIGAAEPKGHAGQTISPAEHNRWLGTLADHVRSLGRGVVAVTSVESSDLTGIAATGLARELGRRGVRVLLLDLDPANAPVASIAPDPRAPGLAELVFGMATFGEVIQRDRASRIHVIPVGRGVRDVSALLAGERLAIVLGASSQTYDHVVLAAPPLASMARAGRLARFCRGAVLVTAAGSEGAGAATSDALAAQGFAHVAVTPMGPIEPVERGSGQAAA
jgi:Mrp family chromosome partitioning ATPase